MSAGLREEILGALACVQGALRSDDVNGHAVVQLSAAVSALNRANDMLRPACAVCGDYGCEFCPGLPDNVIPFAGRAV